jgi:hypothetical protein
MGALLMAQIKLMKIYSALSILAFATLFITSCKKDDVPTTPKRTIKFILYTEEDFSTDNHNITFSLFIRTHSKTLFDSSLSTIKVKDIPNFANRLIFEKTVPNDDGSDLAAGFNYAIENVGLSWYLDTCKAGQTFKEVSYSFK